MGTQLGHAGWGCHMSPVSPVSIPRCPRSIRALPSSTGTPPHLRAPSPFWGPPPGLVGADVAQEGGGGPGQHLLPHQRLQHRGHPHTAVLGGKTGWGERPLNPQTPAGPPPPKNPNTHRELVALKECNEHPGHGAGGAVHLRGGTQAQGGSGGGVGGSPGDFGWGGGSPTVWAWLRRPPSPLYMMFSLRLW